MRNIIKTIKKIGTGMIRQSGLFPVLMLGILYPLGASAYCGNISTAGSRAQPFEFVVSKPRDVRRSDLKIEGPSRRFSMAARVSQNTPLERTGTKISQRTEIRETASSSRLTRAGETICYSFDFWISSSSDLPRNRRNRAKLVIAQFHQEATRRAQGDQGAAIFIEMSPSGAVEAIFGDPVGARRRQILAPNRSFFDRWWRMEVAAKWSSGGDGTVSIWLAPTGERPKLRMTDRGRNTTTGHVYQKLGVYRPFLERDPSFAKNSVTVFYKDIRRNGQRARFRRN